MTDLSNNKRERQRERRRIKEEFLEEAKKKEKLRKRIWTYSIIGVVAVGIFVLIFFLQQSGGDGDEIVATEPTATTEEDITDTTEDTTEEEPMVTPVLEFDDSHQLCLDLTQEYEAVFTTSEGTIRVLLDTTNTPGTANNFYVLAKYGYYNGTLLFRTDPSIAIIQGGAPHTNSPSDPGPGYTILDEGTDFSYEPGQLVMARTGAPNSSGAQFFFAVNQRTSLLDGQGTYVVFGETTEGLDVLVNILDLHVDDPTSSLGGGPSRDVMVEKVEVNALGPKAESDSGDADGSSPNYTTYSEADYGTGPCPGGTDASTADTNAADAEADGTTTAPTTEAQLEEDPEPEEEIN